MLPYSNQIVQIDALKQSPVNGEYPMMTATIIGLGTIFCDRIC